MSAPILDQFGRPYTTSTRFRTTDDDRYRLPRPRLDADIALLLSKEKYRLLLCDNRYIREAFPLVGGAVEQKADYVSASGWLPEFTGKDRAWGRRVKRILHAALQIIDVRGDLFSWDDIWWTSSTTLDVDGSHFTTLTETAETGFPQIQNIEAHRIGQRSTTPRVETGPYKGLRIINGIIYNSAGREVAYNILAETPGDPDQQISARDMLHVCHPKWFSDGRPVGALAVAVLDWYDIKEAREFQRIKQKVNAALTLIESNEKGEAPGIPPLGAGPPPVGGPDGPQTPYTDILMGGLVRYVRAGSGTIEAHESNSPSDGWRQFDHTLVAGSMYGMGWRVEMMDLSRLTGAGVRGFQDNINTSIYARHRRLSPRAIRVTNYTMAKLIKRGDIEEHPEWDRWNIPEPTEFTVDAARSQQADRENVRAGFDSHPRAIRRYLGANAEDILYEEAEYKKRRKEIAEEFGLTPDELGTDLQTGDSGDAVRKLSPDDNPPDDDNSASRSDS